MHLDNYSLRVAKMRIPAFFAQKYIPVFLTLVYIAFSIILSLAQFVPGIYIYSVAGVIVILFLKCHHNMTIGLITFTVSCDITVILKCRVNDPSFIGIHGLKRKRTSGSLNLE